MSDPTAPDDPRDPAAAGTDEASRRAEYDRRFESNPDRQNLFRGVFATADEARGAIPRDAAVGYDNAASAGLYTIRSRPDAYDYAPMFWLRRAFDEGARSVFDVGGHVGLKWYAFRDAIGYPPELRWTVCDVPAVIAEGARIARERGVDAQLRFTDDYAALAGCDVLFASGALQYLPMSLADWLRGLPALPSRIVLNTTPLHPDREFFTVNSTGAAFCPYRVMREGALVGALRTLGYRAIDRWVNVGKTLTVPFEDGYDLPEYRGMYLVRA